MRDKIKQCENILGFEILDSRKVFYTELRAVLYKIIRETNHKMPLKEIGSHFNRNHSSVIYGLKNVNYWMDNNKKLKFYYDILYPVFMQKSIKSNLVIYKNNEVIENFQGLRLCNIMYDKNNVKIYIE